MYRILHLSDLHRTSDDPMHNDALISAIVRDFESHKQEIPPIGPIDAVIVSGDLIQGVGLDDPNPGEEIDSQYRIAKEFLEDITDRFLDGDKTRVVLVPGNHDVDWNTARTSMIEVPSDKQDLDLRKYIFVPGTPYRFCYKSRKLFIIEDEALYASRFDRFRKFLTEFYKGVDPAFPLDNGRYHNLFELAAGDIVVAGFNSCFDNDCFRFTGAIPDGEIGNAFLTISDSRKDYKLRIAVWHHGTYGPPESTDYMRMAQLDEMASKDFQLGLHGHQHKLHVYPRKVHLPSDQEMMVVSVGSFCVGARELPPGELQQYNIIEIADDWLSARLHVREMQVERAFGPRRVKDFGGNSFMDFPVKMQTRHGQEFVRIIEAADELVAKKEFPEAIELLMSIQDKSSHARRLLIHSCIEANDDTSLVHAISDPQSITELVYLIDALLELGKSADARTTLEQSQFRLDMQDSQRDELIEKINLAGLVKK